jgi:uncharacterized protein (TIGR03437 family)
MGIRGGAPVLLLASGMIGQILMGQALMGQTFNNQTLTGKYNFRHLLFTTDTSENITDIRSLWGSISFNGNGNYGFSGQSAVNGAAPVAANGSGTYTVTPAGIVTLTNPQNNALQLNARWGLVSQPTVTLVGPQPGEAMLIGSSTENAGNTFDLFVAILAGQGASNGNLTGSYFASTLAFPSGSAALVRSGLFTLQANGQGGFANISVSGHGANLSSGAFTAQTVTGATYTVQADGSGSANFPLQTGSTSATQILAGNETIYVSSSGNVILGGANDGSTQDIWVGFKAGNGLTWTDRFWHAGLRFESPGNASAYSGSLALINAGNLTFTRRLRQLQPTGAITYDFTGTNAFTLGPDGSGTAALTRVALGAAGNGFVGTAVDPNDPGGYELYLGVRMPPVSGTGVFLNPQGVVNAASFAPVGNSISPGEFVTLFGTNLAAVTESAGAPFPPNVAGVSVLINGLPAPIYLVSSGQINALVPYATTGPTASIVVNNNGTLSNTVQVPLAATAPGVFSIDRNGIGSGAILHADFSLMTSGKPAKRGETVLVYLTGLGAVNPPVADGTAGGATNLSKAAGAVNVLIGGLPATVSYAGLAPLYPGLYQLNVVVPADLAVSATGPVPLAVQTSDSFHDQVDLIVSP